jgi:hypothetical protein
MATTSFIDLDTSTEDAFFSGLQSGDRFTAPRIRRKTKFLSSKRKKGVTQRSLLPIIAPIWNAFFVAEKAAWNAAAAECDLTGYKLFVQDYCARVKNGLVGVATPSLLHQSFVGQLHVEAPATQLKIAQYHPRSYWVSQPVPKHKGMRQPVLVTEDITLPLSLSINYKSNLTSLGVGSFAKFYAEVRSSYQGIDRYEYCEIPFDLVADWKNAVASISQNYTYVIGYTLYIHLYNVSGDLYIDNVKCTHGAVNWVRDTFCKDINQDFTLAFYQIPKHWAGVEVPNGTEYNSVYKDF